jgi:hypothetical protein
MTMLVTRLCKAGFSRIGERVFDLQMAILAREGHQGPQSDSLPDCNFTTTLKSDTLTPR